MHETSELARRFAALAELGFESVDEAPVDRQIEPVDRRHSRVVHARPAMGTRVAVSAVVRSPGKADEAVGQAFEEMDRLIGIFSHFDGASAASLLNEQGSLEGPPSELRQVAFDSLRLHRLTGGGFDISVAPVVDLLRDSGTEAPASGDLDAALALVGAERIEVSHQRIRFRRQGMRVTLDGIAKGYIVDAVAEVLDRHGIRHYLVEAGGDIRVRGSRGRRRPWRVGVQDPDKGSQLPDVIQLSRGAVATSGSYEEHFDPDQERHHIVSSRSGASPRHSSSVTVTAPTAMAADALATSVFLMEPRQGVRFVEALRGAECLVIDSRGGGWRSTGWRSADPA